MITWNKIKNSFYSYFAKNRDVRSFILSFNNWSFQGRFLESVSPKKTHFRRKPIAINVILFSFLKFVTTAYKIEVNRLTWNRSKFPSWLTNIPADLQKSIYGLTKQHRTFGTLQCENLFINITHSNVQNLLKRLVVKQSWNWQMINYFLTW